MAKITTHPHNADRPRLTLELRPWIKVAEDEQLVLTLAAGITRAYSVTWIEVALTIDGAPLAYFRNMLQSFTPFRAADFEPLFTGEVERLEVGDMFPDSRLVFCRETFGSDAIYTVQIDLNVGQVYGVPTDEWRVQFTLDWLKADTVRAFLRELEHDFEQVQAGQTPDPASVPIGYGTLPLARQLNTSAYDHIAPNWNDDPLSLPLNETAFAAWLSRLPAGARVLDVGCGHGEPVVRRLLEQGYRVTGIDLSEGMLALARNRFPQATFRRCTVAELDEDGQFDGVCSFFSLLHTDPIELRVSLERIWRALKPGGYLLVASVIPDIYVRGAPVTMFKGQTVWQYDYAPEEVQAALIERGRFALIECTELAHPRPRPETPPVEAQPSAVEANPTQSTADAHAADIEPVDDKEDWPELEVMPAEEAQALLAEIERDLAESDWGNLEPIIKFFAILAQRLPNGDL